MCFARVYYYIQAEVLSAEMRTEDDGVEELIQKDVVEEEEGEGERGWLEREELRKETEKEVGLALCCAQ